MLTVALVLLLALWVPYGSGNASAEGPSPPWEHDTAALGSLRFYDPHGDLVTGGSVARSPFAAYVQASVDGGDEDDLASLYVFTPQEGALPSAWPGRRLSGPTSYPDATAPSRVNGTVLPVLTGYAGDPSLASYVATHPNEATASGYAGIYQLRLYTSRSGADGAASYSATYVAVDGDTWTQIHPAGDSTTVALSVAPPSWIPGTTSVSLVAKLTPVTVGGTITFYDGANLLGTLPDRAIQAFLDELELPPGGHVLSATFRPDTAPFTSSSTSVYYQSGALTAEPTTTTLTVNPAGPVVEGTTVTLTATVQATTAPGSVGFYDGPHLLATVTLSQGAAAFATTGLKASTHHLSAEYVPSSTAYKPSESASVALKVKKKGETSPGDDQQVISVTVPKANVLGTKIKPKGVLGVTGAALIPLTIVGVAGIAAGIAVRSSTRRRRKLGSPEERA